MGPSRLTDEKLAGMWRAGEHDELALLLRGIAVSIAMDAYTRSLAATDVDPDDVISWALEAMWLAITSWDPANGTPLRGWVAFKVRRGIIDSQRRATRKKRGGNQRRVPLEWLENCASLDLEGLGQVDNRQESAHNDPRFEDNYCSDTNTRLAHSMVPARHEAEKFARPIDAGRVREAVRALPRQQRLVLHGTARGASLREVGAALGINRMTVSRELSRARESVRASLERDARARAARAC